MTDNNNDDEKTIKNTVKYVDVSGNIRVYKYKRKKMDWRKYYKPKEKKINYRKLIEIEIKMLDKKHYEDLHTYLMLFIEKNK